MDNQMTNQEAIAALEMECELMQFDPLSGEDRPIEFQNKDNQDLYKANLVAIEAIKENEKLKAINENEQLSLSAAMNAWIRALDRCDEKEKEIDHLITELKKYKREARWKTACEQETIGPEMTIEEYYNTKDGATLYYTNGKDMPDSHKLVTIRWDVRSPMIYNGETVVEKKAIEELMKQAKWEISRVFVMPCTIYVLCDYGKPNPEVGEAE